MIAMGLIKAAPVYDFNADPTRTGQKILILGAGLTGMTAAYQLNKLGYDCTILEARDRIGGRCWSVRNGSTNEETEFGTHSAQFHDDQYFNAGPSRIPNHHELTLNYCKELGVPMEIYNNVNEAAYFYSEGEVHLSIRKFGRGRFITTCVATLRNCWPKRQAAISSNLI